ncbi:MAG: Asp23/Gls24 family envelope stress response protein [Actinobacteria bacterium]|nr:Asp23/Gls24 family envelope stress response protein [Actinomycetota bacterium]
MAIDPDAVVTAALSCPSVAAMASGRREEVATYLPGRRVPGLRISPQEVEVHVVARWGVFLPAMGPEVQSAVAPLAGGVPVTVFVDDIQSPSEELALPPG